MPPPFSSRLGGASVHLSSPPSAPARVCVGTSAAPTGLWAPTAPETPSVPQGVRRASPRTDFLEKKNDDVDMLEVIVALQGARAEWTKFSNLARWFFSCGETLRDTSTVTHTTARATVFHICRAREKERKRERVSERQRQKEREVHGSGLASSRNRAAARCLKE